MLDLDDWPNRTGAVILLEDPDGRIAMQLRDDDRFQDHWGLFGGWVGQGEAPRAAICREVSEDLTIDLEPSRLTFLTIVYLPHLKANCHVCHYPVPDDLDYAILTEGQAFAFFDSADLIDRPIVPHHRDLLDWYWSTSSANPAMNS